MNIPNSLSLTRICLIPLFIAMYFVPYEWGAYAAIAVFLLCCFTDFLDGYIARKYHMVTDLGKLLDPIADKILVCAALFCVVATNPLQYFYGSVFDMSSEFAASFGTIFLTVGSILILARELLISAVRMIAASKGIVVQANVFGKIKTVTQDVSLPLLILLNVAKMYQALSMRLNSATLWTDVIWLISVIVFGLAVIMTIVSGVIYMVQNRKVFENK
ncbi:MAG: CDP-alcohol phosphatidyltransferase family protein [Corallococcus sp.]|nr:CDP-alcohol phosphatidyltransferase family protein [Bacillota bacterium]MCM1533547.1 CDP-alcohol phosphatidyltransferase family protein [Corallococcus sp.]